MQQLQGESQREVDADDGWHWPTLLYIALHILHLDEASFWRMRPIKFMTLVDVHAEVNSQDEEKAKPKKKPAPVVETTIDQAPSWW